METCRIIIMMSWWRPVFFFCVLLTFCSISNGLIHHLTITDDSRASFYIENFGFDPHGYLFLNATNTRTNFGSLNPKNHRLGFVIKHKQTNYDRFLQDNSDEMCLLDVSLEDYEYQIMLDDWTETIKHISIGPDATGFYDIYFINCDEDRKPVSFDLELIMYNPGPDYLSSGDSFLPTVYFMFFTAYACFTLYWIVCYMIPAAMTTVLDIHYLMLVAILLKCGAVFFHSVDMYYLGINGHPGTWTLILKGITFFVVISLIGSGWAFIKPYLSEKDKQIFLVVIPLQVVNNIILAIIEETAPGGSSVFDWVDLFRIIDLLCCIAVLVPIVSSIKHLQEAAKVDGKAAENMEKLKVFREFYLLFVSYIYFTRVIVYLLNSTLYYNWMWVSVFISESCTILFFVTTGYYFRPLVQNRALPVARNDK